MHTVSEQWWCQKSDHTGNHVTIKVKPKSTYYMDVFDFRLQWEGRYCDNNTTTQHGLHNYSIPISFNRSLKYSLIKSIMYISVISLYWNNLIKCGTQYATIFIIKLEMMIKRVHTAQEGLIIMAIFKLNWFDPLKEDLQFKI